MPFPIVCQVGKYRICGKRHTRRQRGCNVRTAAVPLVVSAVEEFPTLDEMERAMIVAAYRRSNRKPLEAARLLGIGKTTF